MTKVSDLRLGCLASLWVELLFRAVNLPSSTRATRTIETLLPCPALSPNLSLSLWAGISWGNTGHYHSWGESGFSTRLTDPQINTSLWMCGSLPNSAGGALCHAQYGCLSQRLGQDAGLGGPRKDWGPKQETRKTLETEGERKRGGGWNTGVQLLVGWSYRLRRSEYGSLLLGSVKKKVWVLNMKCWKVLKCKMVFVVKPLTFIVLVP